MSRASTQLRSSRDTTVWSYTVAQASVLTGVPQKLINQYLDRELSCLITIGAGFRAVRKDGLGYIRLNHDLSAFSSEMRAEVIRWVMSNPRLKSIDVPIPSCKVTVRVDLARSAVAANLAKWRQAKDMISENEEVMSGEPCVKGTRVPVYGISDAFRAGDYDDVRTVFSDISDSEISAALMFAEMFPKKGRPRSVGARLDMVKPTRSRSVRVKLPT